MKDYMIENKCRFLKSDGTPLNDEWYDWVGDFNNGFAKVKKEGLGYSFINTEGKHINDEWYDVVVDFYNGFARVYKKGLGYNFINTEGQYLTDDWYDWVYYFKEGFVKVYKTAEDYDNDAFYYLDNKGILYDENKQLIKI